MTYTLIVIYNLMLYGLYSYLSYVFNICILRCVLKVVIETDYCVF